MKNKNQWIIRDIEANKVSYFKVEANISKKSRFNIFIKVGLTILILALMIFAVVKAVPPTSPYNPGETLAPSCAPGDTNCTVIAPAISTRLINTTAPLSGGGDLSADRTFSIGGLSSLGTANYLVGVNSGATAWEYKQLLGTTNQLTVTHGTGSITLSLPQDIATTSSPTFAGLTLNPYGTLTGQTGEIRFLELAANGTNYVGFKAPDSLGTNNIYVLPSAYPAISGYALISDTSGNLSWSQAGVNDATYLTLSPHDSLSAERVLTTGTNISFTDGGANSTLTIATVTNPTFSTSVTTPLLQTSSGLLTIQTGASTGADDIVFSPAGAEKMRILENGDLFFEKGTNDVTITVTAPASARTYTIPDFGANVSFVGTNRSISTTSPLSGGGDLSTDRTFSIGGLSSLGTANYLVGVNSGATAWEYKQLLGTTDQITVTHGAGSITLATPQSIATTSTPQFARLGLGAAADATNILTVTSASTTNLSKSLNISHTGAITGTGYAGYFSKTGASTTNVGLYATASGATYNYAAIFDSGNVGIGTTTPGYKLDVNGQINLPANTWITGGGSYLVRNSYMGYSSDFRAVQIGKELSNAEAYDVAIAIGVDPSSVTGGSFYRSEIAFPNFIEFIQKNSTGSDWIRNVMQLNNGLVSVSLGSTASTTAVCSSLANGTAPAAGTAYELRDCSGTPAADYAEFYPTEEGLEPGDLVAPSQNIVQTNDNQRVSKLTKTDQPYQPSMIGVVSDPSNVTDFNVIGYNIKEEDNRKPISLSGRVEVKVSTENGEIKIGDYLTSSSQPGIAMKATEAGRVIGIALESYNSEGIGKIMVFVNPHWYIGQLVENGLLNNNEQGTANNEKSILSQFTLAVKNSLEKLGLFIENGVAKVEKLLTKEIETETIKTKEIETEKLCLKGDDGETICLDKNQLKELLAKNVSNAQPQNSEPEASVVPPKPVCDAEHLDLCNTQELCEGAKLYWYSDGTCHNEPEAPKCKPNWQPGDWEPAANPDTLKCGETVSQKRTYNNLNNCGIADGKPADESQEVKGTLCSAPNATGTCQADGTCSFTCQDGYSNCDNDMSNGCETQGECQPSQTETH
jgi:hypothetical protein